MCIYSPMPHTLSYCALIGKCALIRSNTVAEFAFLQCRSHEAAHNEPAGPRSAIGRAPDS